MAYELPEFDELMKMAQENPEELEALRQKLCDQLIMSAPKRYQRRLRGLQFQIDMERRRAKTPMAACLRISEMMHDSFLQLRDALNDAQGITQGAPATSSRLMQEMDTDAADVIQFPGR